MSRIREWFLRLWGAVRGNPRDAEMAEELRLHLELATEDMQRRMGATDKAVRAAHLRAGGVAQAMEALRDQRGLPWVADLAQDVRHGFRLMRRSPGFTIVACVVLALGIGANTAIFSLVNVLVWRDLPVRDPESLVQFTFQYPRDPPLNMFGLDAYERYRDRNDVFTDVIGTAPFSVRPGAGSLNPEWVTTNYFTALDVRPALGRVLEPSDGAPGAEPVAVMSWIYWKNQFNLDPRVLGTTMTVRTSDVAGRTTTGTVADVSVRVVGVTREGFSGLLTGYRTDLWVPAANHPNIRQAFLMLMARLKPGVTIEQATAQMRVLDRPRIEGLGVKDPQWLGVTIDVTPARSGFSTPLHQQFGQPLLVVMAIVAVLLLLTCANLGSLLLARAAARQREMALRVSLGASRSRVVRQVLTESLLLSIVGTLFGAAGAYLGTDGLVRIMAAGTRVIGAPPSVDVPVDASVLAFTATAAVLAAVLFALPPAWIAFLSAPASALRVTGATGPPRSGRLFGNGLVVAQVALSLVLLSVAGLCLGHLSNLRNRDLGFDRTSVLLVTVDTANTASDRERSIQLYRELLERFEAVPGVRSATVSGTTPIHGAAASRFLTVDGFEEPPHLRSRVPLNGVAPKYFETFGTPLLAGRDFQFADANRAKVAIINEATGRHYFAGRNPLGRQLLLENDARPFEIVGVVADAKYSNLRAPAPPTVYTNALQQSRLPSMFALRTSVPPASIASDVRRIIDEVLRGAPVTRMRTLTEQLDASIVPERLTSMLSGFFGGLGVLLAAIGLYGLLAYTVARRTNEIGIRMALGATRRDVTHMVLKQALSLVGVGLILGVPVAIWSRQIAVRMLEGMSVASAVPTVVAAGLMIGVALLAAYLPARRATRVEPLTALRSE